MSIPLYEDPCFSNRYIPDNLGDSLEHLYDMITCVESENEYYVVPKYKLPDYIYKISFEQFLKKRIHSLFVNRQIHPTTLAEGFSGVKLLEEYYEYNSTGVVADKCMQIVKQELKGMQISPDNQQYADICLSAERLIKKHSPSVVYFDRCKSIEFWLLQDFSFVTFRCNTVKLTAHERVRPLTVTLLRVPISELEGLRTWVGDTTNETCGEFSPQFFFENWIMSDFYRVYCKKSHITEWLKLHKFHL